MNIKPLGIGVVGSGMISEIYLTNMIRRFDILNVKAITSAHLDRAKVRGDQFGIPAVTLEAMLADPAIDMIVNLTPAHAHEGIIRRALEAGKHVYTEKTLTASAETALALKQLAREKSLWLGSAPDTFLGAALQTARKALDDGLIGEVNSFALSINRDNNFFTSFFPFLNQPAGGAGYDYAVYYLTSLVSLLGPVAQVAAFVDTPYPTHTDINPKSPTFGQVISTPNESRISAALRLVSGVTGTLHLDHDSVLDDQSYFALYGTKGILYLPNPDRFDGEVRLLPNRAIDQPIQPARSLDRPFGFAENSRGVGPAEMAWSIRKNRPCRACADMACHVLEVIDGLMRSSREGRFVDIHTRFERPRPLTPNPASEEASIME